MVSLMSNPDLEAITKWPGFIGHGVRSTIIERDGFQMCFGMNM
jgi:hypothetical protein